MKKVTMLLTILLMGYASITDAQVRDRSLDKTKGYIVYAMGVNTLSNTEKNVYDNLDTGSSRFYEIGYARNTRLSKSSNLWHLNYGLSLVYNNIRMKNGYAFKQMDKDVVAQQSSDISRARLTNSYLQVPIYLEFDFATDERLANPNKMAKKTLKIGVGGYAGVRLKTKQYVKYKDDKKATQRDFKTNKFAYGIGAYVGYSIASIYVKYDLQEMFEHNTTNNPHNVSIGLRIDL